MSARPCVWLEYERLCKGVHFTESCSTIFDNQTPRAFRFFSHLVPYSKWLTPIRRKIIVSGLA